MAARRDRPGAWVGSRFPGWGKQGTGGLGGEVNPGGRRSAGESLAGYPGGRVVREMARRGQAHGLGPEEESGILPYTIFTVVLDSKLIPLVAG